MEYSRLEELREYNNLTKKQLAKIIDVSDSVYSRWENGKYIIPTKRLYQLANYYKLNIDYILGLTKNKIEIRTSKDLDMKLISKRMKEIRSDYNETLRVFAKRLNTSSSTWSAYESGKTLILCAFLIEVCKFSEYSSDYLLGRTNDKYRK